MRSHTITLKRARRFPEDTDSAGAWSVDEAQGTNVGGYHFRRQHPVGPYILDFFCSEVRLAIEIDGESHGAEGAQAHDARRDAWLLARGIATLRIPAEVLKYPDAVAQMILAEVRGRAPSVTP